MIRDTYTMEKELSDLYFVSFGTLYSILGRFDS